ncbi:MAG: outer membrane beta-barrel protein, partial [Gemmatimonadota bacterium]
TGILAALAAITALLAAPPAAAQSSGLTLEAYAGGADFGRFLEDRSGMVLAPREREVSFERALALGGSLGINLWENTGIRAQGTYVGTELVFRDDTPDGGNTLDVDDVSEVTITTLGVEVIKYLLDPGRDWSPYGVAGITAVRWNAVGERVADIGFSTNDEDSLWRMGGVAGLGLELRPSRALAVRLEASTYALGSPFDGTEAWSTNGTTVDEPSAGRMTRATVGLAWTFGMDGRSRARTRRGSK